MSEYYERSKTNPGAVINTDNDGLKAYKLKKQRNKKIDNLESEVDDIKNLLNQILEKLK